MDGVDEVIGLHLWAAMPVGRIGLIAGPAMAAPDTFQCTITGKGGHAAMPHDTVDPIAIGAQVVTALQQVVSRMSDPLDPCVLSVTQFIAGTAFNVIPGSAYLPAPCAPSTTTLRREMPERMERLIRGICDGFGATCDFTYELGYRPVVNDPALTARLAGVVTRHLRRRRAAGPMRPTMGGEDFSAYQQRAPGVFAFVGARTRNAASPCRTITRASTLTSARSTWGCATCWRRCSTCWRHERMTEQHPPRDDSPQPGVADAHRLVRPRAPARGATASATIVITNANLIDGSGAAPQRNVQRGDP